MSKVDKAIEVLNNGGIVIFPTDTAYGIGCRMDNEEAVKRLFKIRKRPAKQAVPVLVNSIEMAKDYFEKTPAEVDMLMEKFWPGALTIVYEAKKNKVLDLVRGGGDTIGLRMPNNNIALSLIERVGVPILGSSANFHNGKTPFAKNDLDESLIKLVDYVLEGDSSSKMTSTVLDCSKVPWIVLRQGMVNL